MTTNKDEDYTVHEYLKRTAGVTNENYWIKSKGISKLDMDWEFENSEDEDEFDEGFEFLSIWTVIKKRTFFNTIKNRIGYYSEKVTIMLRSTDVINEKTKFSDVEFHSVVGLKCCYGLKSEKK